MDDQPSLAYEKHIQDFEIQDFEENNKGKTFQEVLISLDINQKYFIML